MSNRLPRALLADIAAVIGSGDHASALMMLGDESGPEASAAVSSYRAQCAAALGDFDAAAFGCPAMGAEELEDGEFAPMFDTCLPLLGGKKIALFGSYGWGDGEWMRNWEETCTAAGAVFAADSVIAHEVPQNNVLAACRALGAALAA